jgi:hypothetical protein
MFVGQYALPGPLGLSVIPGNRGFLSRFDLPLTLQHLHGHTSRKISKLKAISIKLTPIRLRYFCLVAA